MKETMILILKGFIIGLGKIIPGVSGSLLAITLGVYEKCIDIISHIFRDFKNNLFYLTKLGIGVLAAILIGSRLIIYLLSNYYFITLCLFIGLIVGTIGSVYKNIKIKRKTDYLYILIPFILIIILEMSSSNLNFVPRYNIFSYFEIIFIGFLEALTMIVPGVSGTAIFILFGYYDFILSIFRNPFTIFMMFFVVGLILGIILVSKIINYLFEKFKDQLYLVIMGLVLSSICLLIFQVMKIPFTLFELIAGIFLFIMGCKISKKLG